MNHSEAIETSAAEAYLLGDLSDTDREAFEEHYVDCNVCSTAVFSGAAALATGKRVVESENTFRRVKSRSWIPASVASATAAAALVVTGYQAYVLPRVMSLSSAPRMEVVTQGGFSSGAKRTSEKPLVIHFDAENRQVLVTILLPAASQFPNYVGELRNTSGELVVQQRVSAAKAKDENGVLYLLRPLPAGRYVLLTLGVREDGNRSEVDRTFVVVK